MAIPKKILKFVQERDTYCIHCGQTEDLVPHHRRGRGMGGSKLLDRPDNLIMVCAIYNGLMESDFLVARDARGWGHKLSQWEHFSRPIFDSIAFKWYVLTESGRRIDLSVLQRPE